MSKKHDDEVRASIESLIADLDESLGDEVTASEVDGLLAQRVIPDQVEKDTDRGDGLGGDERVIEVRRAELGTDRVHDALVDFAWLADPHLERDWYTGQPHRENLYPV